MHHTVFTDASLILTGENIIIACCYFAISLGIAYGVWRNRHAGVDPLVMAVAGIFFSCALGHGMHGAGMLGLPNPIVWQVATDFVTVIIAVYFLSFYRSFDLLARFSQIFTSKVELEDKNKILEQAMLKLQLTQSQLIQQEKMSSLGQLVAGVAHEINNPVNFIYANLDYIQEYVQDLLEFIELYQKHFPTPVAEIRALSQKIDLEFVKEDLFKIFKSMKIGTERIKEIVLSLRNFSRVDEAELKKVDIHEGIDSTLLILQHRFIASPENIEIDIVKNYGDIPQVECYPGQLNQVFMNILANAVDALEEINHQQKSPKIQQEDSNRITISSYIVNSRWVEIKIANNGPYIPIDFHQRIFDPFFTTKPVGKGTGMGMSISYQIITEKHKGKLMFTSNSGADTEFIIQIPIVQTTAMLLAS
ncbi:integral membrane sensor signal transduction histidine kinase [Calothrix sp. NIES-4071]|nr:integral membrane sensor signal transduction histidine kinase [Calothrix sp. NIES-4071]BAZ61351.1 integral membrane sensor signal transduction histidine kinase [Calothrix sp. NIES-4105]